jgi:hypothetical protein
VGSLTFVVGTAADVFPGELAPLIVEELRKRFPAAAELEEDAYESEPVHASGWRALQQRVLQTLDMAPQITAIDAYQAVYLPDAPSAIQHLPIANLADPLQVGSVPALVEDLSRFAEKASLPTDDLELMQLGAHFLEHEDEHAEIDVQTYVQLMLSAKQAVARKQALWIVT